MGPRLLARAIRSQTLERCETGADPRQGSMVRLKKALLVRQQVASCARLGVLHVGQDLPYLIHDAIGVKNRRLFRPLALAEYINEDADDRQNGKTRRCGEKNKPVGLYANPLASPPQAPICPKNDPQWEPFEVIGRRERIRTSGP
jgi:hypothetical protein